MKVAIFGSKVENADMTSYNQIKDIVEKSGNTVDFSFFENKIEDEYQDPEGTYRRNQKMLKDNDIFIVDITLYSSGIGYLIGNLLGLKKPTLVLFNQDMGEMVSSTVKSSAIKSKSLSYVEYNDSDDFNRLILKYLADAKGQLDTKFILIIPPEIDRYLEWASSHRRMHKAQIVRDAVEDVMKVDDEWLALND